MSYKPIENTIIVTMFEEGASDEAIIGKLESLGFHHNLHSFAKHRVELGLIRNAAAKVRREEKRPYAHPAELAFRMAMLRASRQGTGSERKVRFGAKIDPTPPPICTVHPTTFLPTKSAIADCG